MDCQRIEMIRRREINPEQRRGGGGESSRFLFISEFDERQKKKKNHLTRTLLDALPLNRTRRKWLHQTARARQPT